MAKVRTREIWTNNWGEMVIKPDIYGDIMHKICKKEKGNIAYILVGRYKVMNISPCSYGNAWEYESYFVISKIWTLMPEELKTPKFLMVWTIGKCNTKTLLHWELCMKGDIRISETRDQF